MRSQRFVGAALVVFAGMGCELSSDVRPQVRPSLRVVDAGRAQDASVPRDADVTADAAPSDLDEVADAHPYVFRELSFGLIVVATRQTSVLRRDGDRASLRVTIERPPHAPGTKNLGGSEVEPTTWEVAQTETFVGTIRAEDKRTVFHLSSAAGKPLELSCAPGRLAIHRRGAQLVPHRYAPGQYHSECSETGVWRPSATQTIDVLKCGASDRDVDHFGRFGGTALLLAPMPGVESVFVNSDCVLQGGGYRRMGVAP
jgi:hypothetical protein